LFKKDEKKDLNEIQEEQKICPQKNFSEPILLNNSEQFLVKENQEDDSIKILPNSLKNNKNNKTKNLQSENNSITDYQVKILNYNEKELEVNDKNSDINPEIYEFIDKFKTNEIKKKQDLSMLMSQYKNYIRIIIKQNEENFSFAFDPENQKIIYYDPENDQIDKNKYLIVTKEKKFEKKNNNKSNVSQNENDNKSNPKEDRPSSISQKQSNNSNNNKIESSQSKYSFLSYLSKNLNINYRGVNLKNDNNKFLDFCKRNAKKFYFFIIQFEIKNESQYFMISFSFEENPAEHDGYLETKEEHNNFYDLIENYCFKPFQNVENHILFLENFLKKNENVLTDLEKLPDSELKQMIKISQDLLNNREYLKDYKNSKNFLENIKKNTNVCIECKCNNDVKKSLYQLDRLLLDFQSIYNRRLKIIGIVCLSTTTEEINDLVFVDILDKIRLIEKTFNVELVILNIKNCFYGFDIEKPLDDIDIHQKIFSDELRQEKEKEIDQLKQEKEKEIQELRKENYKILVEKEKEIDEILLEKEKEIDEIKQEKEKEIDEIKQEKEKEIDEIKQEKEKEIDEILQEKEKEIQELKNQIRELKKNAENKNNN